MPRMGGVELVQQTTARWPSLPVLLVSGRTQPSGTQAFMSKPFGWQALMKGIDDVINKQEYTAESDGLAGSK